MTRSIKFTLGFVLAVILISPALNRPATAARFHGLYSAILRNDIGAVYRLTPGRRSINSVDRSTGATPLTWACMKGINPRIVEWLISRGADVEKKDGEGHTPLTTAAYYGNVGAVRILLSKGADPDATDKRGQPPLVAASSRRGRLEIVQALVAKGVKVDGRFGSEALEMALGSKRRDIADFLIARGAKPSYFRAIRRFYHD